MCGIGGIVHYDDADIRDRLVAIRDRLRHRGPDDNGLYVTRYAGLVHTRLALVDPVGGAQPMHSPDGRYTLTYNGEVYNAAELRSELSDRWTFRTRCSRRIRLSLDSARSMPRSRSGARALDGARSSSNTNSFGGYERHCSAECQAGLRQCVR